MQSNEVSRKTLQVFAVILFGLIIVFHLGLALAGKPLIRGNHLGAALEYARGPINLLRPVIVGFNANGTPTALEFPLWQAAVGLVFKITHSTWYGWGNIVSLLIFATAPWPVFQLARQYLGDRAAWWSVIFFLAQPAIIVFSGWAAADGLSLVVMIWFLYFADRMIRSGNVAWWIPSALFAALSATSKMPFFMTAGFCTIFMLLINRIRAWRPWVLLASTGLFAAIVFAVWTQYCNHLAAEAVFPFKELRLSQSPYIRFWYFGDLHYRLSLAPWAAAGWRFIHDNFGALPMVVLALVSLVRRGNLLPKLWLLGAFITTLVFAQVVLRHWHYWLMCSPAVAMLCGATLARWEPFMSQEIPWKSIRLALISLVLLFSAVEGIVAMRLAVYLDPYIANVAKVIRDHTQPKDRIVLYDRGFFGWGADALFRAHREGVSVSDLHTNPAADPNVTGLTELLTDPANLSRLKALGYDKLVMISESPTEQAAQTLVPGGFNRTRNIYPASISPTVDAWPVVYQTPDIIIKDIP